MVKNVSLRLIFLLVSCVCSTKLLASSAPESGMDLDNRPALERAISDNPKSLLAWVRKQLAELDPNAQPRHWVRALWVYATLDEEWKTEPDKRALIDKALLVAERERMYQELVAFKSFISANLIEGSGQDHKEVDEKVARAEYEGLISLAHNYGLKYAEAESMANYAFYLQDLGESARSLQLLLDANQLIADDPKVSELSRYAIKNDLALAFSAQKQRAKARLIYEEIDAFCQRENIRAFCVMNDYNLGMNIVAEKDQKLVARAGYFFNKALKVALEVDDRWSIATAHSGLSLFHFNMQNFQEALNEADEAVRLFQEQQSKVWVADSLKKGAAALIGAKRYRDALGYIERARSTFPSGFRRDFCDLDELSYQAWRGLGNIEKALEHLERHDVEFKKLTQEKEQSEYSKLSVDMGLQIEEEKNKVLSKDNELKNQKLRETERLRLFMLAMLILSGLALASMAVAVIRSGEVKLSRLKMKRILDNIEEGILTMNAQMLVEKEYSHHLQVLLGTNLDLTGRRAVDLLLDQTLMNNEERSMVYQTLQASLGGDELQWGVNEQHLPMELIFTRSDGNKIVAVHWQPLFGQSQLVQAILVGLKDVTARRQLEMEIVLERQRSDLQGQRIRELTQGDKAQVGALLQQAKALESAFPQFKTSRQTQSEILRELHTVKGLARTLGLKELSAKTHELEDRLQKYESNTGPMEHVAKEFLSTVDGFLNVFQQVLGHKITTQTGSGTLCEVVHSLLPSLREHFRDAGLQLSQLDVLDRALPWPPSLLQPVGQILVHALNNSADHGFILPRGRGQIVESPRFQIESRRKEQSVELTLLDNGAGLDLQRLEKLAHTRGFQPEPGRSIADVVFLEGVSTADNVSRTSGRGVGMAAIRSICLERGGDVHLEPNPSGRGTLLTITLPIPDRCEA